MNGFVRATTPTLTLSVRGENIDLTQANNVYVSLKQGEFDVVKTGEDLVVEATVVKVWLSQQETLSLKSGQVLLVQINWTYIDTYGVTQRVATEVGSITITPQLLCEVVS